MQEQRQRREPEPDHMFRGVYVGNELEFDFSTYLDEIDPDSQIFQSICDYIAAFPFTMEYFNRVYPFYNGSKVSEYTICSKLNPDPTEYHIQESEHEDDSHRFHRFYYHDLNQTPPTHEKPHFHASEIIYDDGGIREEYIGSGYFNNVNGEEVPFGRQMGIWGPNGIRRFHLYNRIAMLERFRDGENIDFLPSIQLRLADGTPFDISIDTSEEKNHVRFIENDNDDLFLFEESLQNERRERRRIEKIRQLEYEQQIIAYELQRKREQKCIEKMQKLQNRENQKKIENERQEIQMTRWANFNASAYVNHPATIEMAQKFSAPPEPFVYRNLPIPTALPHEYRNPAPILDDDDEI
jgi:hypothetical protein